MAGDFNPLIRIKGYIESVDLVKPAPPAEKWCVPIYEPATLLTDYLLGLLTAVLGWRMARQAVPESRTSPRLFGAALGATALGSFTGGTYHGFAPVLGSFAGAVLWKAATLSMGFASFLLTAAVITSVWSAAARRRLILAAAFKLAIYAVWMVTHDDFLYVIVEYGSSLIIMLALLAAGRMHGAPRFRMYLAGGILVSIVAAAIQQSGVRLHRHFNHNDLMHVVQMGAVWLLYQGGRRLHDADGRS